MRHSQEESITTRDQCCMYGLFPLDKNKVEQRSESLSSVSICMNSICLEHDKHARRRTIHAITSTRVDAKDIDKRTQESGETIDGEQVRG